MFVPLSLITAAVLSAAVVAYGTHAGWMQYGTGGLGVILFSRRLQWPLVCVALIGCVALIAVVIAGRRRAWWLIGLAPVLALFVHRFANDPSKRMLVLDGPAFVSAEDAAAFLNDDDHVVGLRFEGAAYAYPFAVLYRAPIVLQATHDKRMLLMWSATANRAIATTVDRQLKARDLEVVSTPGDALLLYDGRLGQFVNGVTGLAPGGTKPTGFGTAVPTTKMRWKQWRALNPETTVLAPVPGAARDPAGPLRPAHSIPLRYGGLPPDAPVVVVGGPKPVAIPSADVSAAPLNTRAGDVAVLVFRDPRSGQVRAFDRRIEDDLISTFRPNDDPRRAGAVFVDDDTGTGWNADGLAVSGRKEFKGRRLAGVTVDDGLYWGVMKCWYPDLEVARPSVTPR